MNQPYKTMSIGKLRKEMPDWSWEVTSRGFAGREYEGTKDGRRVTIKAYGVLCGPAEDDTAIRWYAIENNVSIAYTSFFIKESSD